MSKRIFQVSTFTPTATADGLLTAGAYMGLLPGASTDLLKISKVLLEGQASTSAVTATHLARASTLHTGGETALVAGTASDGPVNIAATTLTNLPKAWTTATTAQSNRSPAATVTRLNLTFNAFGGIVQWQTNPGSEEEWLAIGNATTSNSETVLSSYNVGAAGAIGANIFYEVL